MTTKSLPLLALPLVISFTTRFLFQFVDMAFAAKFLGEDSVAAVAAIAFYSPFQAVYIAIWVGLSAGFTATLANAFGHRDEGRVRTLKRAMLKFLCWMVPVLLAFGVGIYYLIPQFGLQPALTENFRIYCTTLMIGMPLTGFWAIHPDSIVKAHHDTFSTMVAGLLASFSNVALNTLFVLGFDMGIFGIALATVLSRLVSLAYAMMRAGRLERDRHQDDSWEKTNRVWPSAMGTILVLSLPGAITFLLAALEGIAVNRVLAGMQDSVTAIASWGVYERILNLSIMPTAGAAVAVVPFVARLLPQGRIDLVRRDLLRTMMMAAAAALVVTICTGWLFAEQIAGFFVAGGGETTTVSPVTIEALRFLPLGALAMVPFYMFRPVFEAAHRPRIGIIISAVRFLVFSVPLVLLSPYFSPALGISGLTGVILALIVSLTLSSALAVRSGWRVLGEM